MVLGVQAVREFRRARNDSYNFNWLLRVPPDFQQPFEVTHASMRALELQTTLEKDLGIELPATLVFEYPTIAELTQHISGLLGDNGDNRNSASPDAMEDWTEEELEIALQRKIDELSRGFHE